MCVCLLPLQTAIAEPILLNLDKHISILLLSRKSLGKFLGNSRRNYENSKYMLVELRASAFKSYIEGWLIYISCCPCV